MLWLSVILCWFKCYYVDSWNIIWENFQYNRKFPWNTRIYKIIQFSSRNLVDIHISLVLFPIWSSIQHCIEYLLFQLYQSKVSYIMIKYQSICVGEKFLYLIRQTSLFTHEIIGMGILDNEGMYNSYILLFFYNVMMQISLIAGLP